VALGLLRDDLTRITAPADTRRRPARPPRSRAAPFPRVGYRVLREEPERGLQR
jgi:hypothetical protein